jgi:hypothetical protein
VPLSVGQPGFLLEHPSSQTSAARHLATGVHVDYWRPTLGRINSLEGKYNA